MARSLPTIRRRWLPAAALATLGTLSAAPASAITYCYVARTPDGFVALRTGPDAGARMVTRMRSGEEVLIETGRNGAWQRVHLMRRTGIDDGYFGPGHAGWMHSRFIERCY